MPGTRAQPRTNRLMPGMLAVHSKHGIGTIVNEWGPIRVFHGETSSNNASCAGIFDVIYGNKPDRFLRSSRREFLQRLFQ